MLVSLCRIMFFTLLLHLSAVPSAPAEAPATVTVFNREIVTFRAPFLGVSARERSERAEAVLGKLLAGDGRGNVTSQQIPQGYAIQLDGVMVFVMIHEDADLYGQESLEQAVGKAMTALKLVVSETSEVRNVASLLRAVGSVALATVALVLVICVMNFARRRFVDFLASAVQRYAVRLNMSVEILLHRERLLLLFRRGIGLAYWLLVLFFVYDWLGFTLGRFPYTRPWGEQLTRYLLDLALSFGHALIKTIPDLLIAVLIFMIAKFVIDMLKPMFARIEEGQFQLSWLDRDTAPTTRRLLSAAIWLFALAMAYPYLPGARTEAFKGLSVLLGLMVSLGASGLVGHAVSGLILMYSRTLRPGEYVQIAGSSGTVLEMGLFNSRILTGQGEQVTLPNSLILNNVSRNYSRPVQGAGIIIHVSVTIGYCTPWRQIHAMLIEAAGRTQTVCTDPAPTVFQVALSDFYPEYRLVCQATTSDPHQRARVISSLHSNIQDVFNEYGVQIMSPHYFSDPADPKIVPKERWYQPPAGKE